VRQPVIGSGSHPDLCDSLEMFERLPCNEPFQTAHDLGRVLAFCTTASHVGPGSWIAAHPGQHDPVQSSVGLTVSATVQPVPATGLAGTCRDRSDATQVRPRPLAVQPLRVVSCSHEQCCCSVGSDPVETDQRWCGVVDELGECHVEAFDLGVEHHDAACKTTHRELGCV
jgi:hypothetical protein